MFIKNSSRYCPHCQTKVLAQKSYIGLLGHAIYFTLILTLISLDGKLNILNNSASAYYGTPAQYTLKIYILGIIPWIAHSIYSLVQKWLCSRCGTNTIFYDDTLHTQKPPQPLQ